MTYTVEEATELLKGDGDILSDDKNLILKFINERKVVSNLSPNRVLKLFYCMKAITKIKGRKKSWKSFRGRTNIVNLVASINSHNYSPYTICDLKCQLKQFYK